MLAPMRPCTSLLAASLAVLPLAAQTAATEPAPHVVVETVGPDGWRMRFAPTNLGSLLESEQGRALWQPGTAPVLGWLQQVFGGDVDFAPVQERLLGYAGRVRLGIWLQEGMLSRQGPFAMALVLEGDGRTALDALAADVRRLQEQVSGEWTELELAGTTHTVRQQGHDRMTAPIVGEHHLLCVAAAEDDLAEALVNARAWVGTCDGKPPRPNTPALRIDVHTPLLLELARAEVAAGGDTEEWDTMQALGFACLADSWLELHTAGPHVQLELSQRFADAPRGLFAALFPTTPGLPALQHLLPDTRGSWKVGRFDLLALYDAIAAAAAVNDVEPEEMRAEIRAEMGVDLRDDLLAHLTDAVVLHAESFADLDRLERTPWSLAFGLRDAKAFGANLETALAKAKPMVTREATIEHGDAKLYRYGNLLGYDVWLAVGDRLFVLAGGADAEDRLTAMLDAARALPEGEEQGLPEDLAPVQRHLPPGLYGAAHGDLDSVVALPPYLWFGLLRGIEPMGSGDGWNPEQQEAFRELLQAHGLNRVRTATGYAESIWRWRLFW